MYLKQPYYYPYCNLYSLNTKQKKSFSLVYLSNHSTITTKEKKIIKKTNSKIPVNILIFLYILKNNNNNNKKQENNK